MKKQQSPFVIALACLLTSIAPITMANAANLSSSASSETNLSTNMDYVLSELTRQHDNASVLIKSAREPNTSLALESSLLNLDKHIDTDSLLATRGGEADVLKRLTAVASNSVSRFSQSGLASWYGEKFHGRTTASGEPFDMNALTAAHPSLPFNSYLKVTNQDNGESVIVKVNDRGPFHSDRMLDLSYAAANEIGLTNDGVGNVTIERVNAP